MGYGMGFPLGPGDSVRTSLLVNHGNIYLFDASAHRVSSRRPLTRADKVELTGYRYVPHSIGDCTM